MTTNREKVLAMRTDNPSMRAIRIAEEIGITRERVRQILVNLGLEANIRDAPTKRNWGGLMKGRGERKPRPVELPKPIEATIGVAPLPTICPKCNAKFLYIEEYHGEWELKCFTCSCVAAFGRGQPPEPPSSPF